MDKQSMAGDEADNDEYESKDELRGSGGSACRGEAAASTTDEPHSRVGGGMECDRSSSPGVRKNVGRYNSGVLNVSSGNNNNVTTRGHSFLEICQLRLLHLFQYLSPPTERYNASEDSIEFTAERLGNDVICYLLKEDLYTVSKDAVSRSMRHNVHMMLNKHSILFTSMVNRLNVVPDTAYEAFMNVADELFLNGGITWARILCLYAFMGRLALWARDRRMHALKNKLPSYVSRYVGEEIAHFIKGYGGWEQLCIEYPVAEEVSGAIWRSLLMTGVTLGLIATILSVAS